MRLREPAVIHLVMFGMALEQLGKELGITKERVRQIESRAQKKLRGLARTEEIVLSRA